MWQNPRAFPSCICVLLHFSSPPAKSFKQTKMSIDIGFDNPLSPNPKCSKSWFSNIGIDYTAM